MDTSVLVKNQTKTYGPKTVKENDETIYITAVVRYDDQCGNGHNTFSITGDIKYGKGGSSGGCIHEEIAKHFPMLAPYIKWHLTSSDGPMHYIANTLYHVDQHEPNRAWVYYTGAIDPLNIGGTGERLLGYLKRSEIEDKEIEGKEGYRINWDEKTAKTRNLDHARSSAVWPDATDEELLDPNLKQRLEERHASLMQEFRSAVESLGFVF